MPNYQDKRRTNKSSKFKTFRKKINNLMNNFNRVLPRRYTRFGTEEEPNQTQLVPSDQLPRIGDIIKIISLIRTKTLSVDLRNMVSEE